MATVSIDHWTQEKESLIKRKVSTNVFNMGNNLSKPVFDKRQESLDEFNLQTRNVQVHVQSLGSKARMIARNMDFCNSGESISISGLRGAAGLKNPSYEGPSGCSKYWNFLQDEE